MYAALIRSAESWRGITITAFEARHLSVIQERLTKSTNGCQAPAVTSRETNTRQGRGTQGQQQRPDPAAGQRERSSLPSTGSAASRSRSTRTSGRRSSKRAARSAASSQSSSARAHERAGRQWDPPRGRPAPLGHPSSPRFTGVARGLPRSTPPLSTGGSAAGPRGSLPLHVDFKHLARHVQEPGPGPGDTSR